MPDYFELLKKDQARFGNNSTPTNVVMEEEEDDFVLDPEATLKKDDLQRPQFLNRIRDYMIERKGVDYKMIQPEQVVDDFVEHMRYFNANTVSTAGEVRFVNKADDAQKEKARQAYEIYEKLGNVFQNDGVYGAVDGVKDYVFAAASDPTNYIGIATGGIARAGAAGHDRGRCLYLAGPIGPTRPAERHPP